MKGRRGGPATENQAAAIGLTAVVAVLGLIALSVAVFQQRFTDTEPVMVSASRAGLLMSPGAMVKTRGVQVGTVGAVLNVPTGARLRLDIESEHLDAVPATVVANIVPTTLFGSKYVELVAPSHIGASIRAGAEIPARHVTAEVNNTFESLVNLLNSAQPKQINAALTSLASSLQDNGTDLGEFIELINTYLREINPHLPKLNADINDAVDVVSQYTDLAPDLVKLAHDGTEISDTLVDHQASLHAMLISFTELADNTGELAESTEHDLSLALKGLRPETRLLARYSPEFPCLIEGLAVSKDLANRAFGGAPGTQPGINGYVGFMPRQEPYSNPRDLPKIETTSDPDCAGLPNVTVGKIPRPSFPSGGPDPYEGDITYGGTGGTDGGLPDVYLGQLLGIFSGLGNLL